MRRVLVVTSITVALGASCQLINGLDSLRFVDGGVDARPDEAAPDANVRDARPGFDCSFDGHAGPTPMVPVAIDAGVSFCIEQTEVTFQQFWEFSQEAGLPEAAPCNVGRNSLLSSDTCETPAHAPVTNVPWCGAYWYCEGLHRELCQDDVPWIHACRGPADTDYPYGDKFDDSRCNVNGEEAGTVPWNGGSCAGGVPGLYDMVGNVAEWVFSCTDPNRSTCYAVGGGYEAGMAGCYTAPTLPNSYAVPSTTRDPQIGFRCCAVVEGTCP